MDFNVKLQELRKHKGLTQEELARALYVSRTAVSKWESGRGYPNIDSLKAIAKLFSVTVDELLSGDQLLTLAEEDAKQKESYFRDLMFGVLDCSVAMAFFLPLFAQKADGVIQAVSLLSLTAVSAYLRVVCFALVAGMVIVGVLTLALQNCKQTLWLRIKRFLSFAFNISGVLVLVLGLQPYAAIFLFAFLIIKVFVLVRKP